MRSPGDEHPPIRIFLVDDDHLFREGLRRLLDDRPEVAVVGEAATPAEALRGVAEHRPDIALLDIRLPESSGIDLCRELRSRHPDLGCVMLTAVTDDEATFQAVMAGAVGYLLKRVRPDELVETLRRVTAGDSLLDRQITDRLVDRVRTAHDPDGDDPLARLEPREREVLDLVTEGLTNAEIAGRVHLAEKTVKNYVSRILRALDVDRRTQVIAYMADVRARNRFTTER